MMNQGCRIIMYMYSSMYDMSLVYVVKVFDMLCCADIDFESNIVVLWSIKCMYWL